MRPLKDRANALLRTIVQDRDTHARWLNTLSFLEHIGCRKIIRSQSSKALDFIILGHIAEEARHAWFFKKLSYKISPNLCRTYDNQFLIQGTSAEKYFQKLDAVVRRGLRRAAHMHSSNASLNYLYVTLLVEERALWLYDLYKQVLEEHKIKLSLRTVLLEEEGHLENVQASLKWLDKMFEQRTEAYRSEEIRLFDRFLSGIESAVQSGLSLELDAISQK